MPVLEVVDFVGTGLVQGCDKGSYGMGVLTDEGYWAKWAHQVEKLQNGLGSHGWRRTYNQSYPKNNHISIIVHPTEHPNILSPHQPIPFDGNKIKANMHNIPKFPISFNHTLSHKNNHFITSSKHFDFDLDFISLKELKKLFSFEIDPKISLSEKFNMGWGKSVRVN